MSVRFQLSIAHAALVAGILALSAPATAEEPDWTKPFIGAQIGYSWDHIDVSGGSPGAFSNLSDFGGVIGGIQGGKNFVQQGGFVGGFVADFNWLDASERASGSQSGTTIVDTCNDACFVETVTESQSAVGLDLEWKASIRGKVGFLAAPNILVYATGGVAFARLEAQASQSSTVTVTTTAPPTTTVTTAAASSSDRATLTGFVIGAGAEMMVAPNIGVFSQVLYYGFETESIKLLGSNVDVDLDETVVEVGVSFYLN